MKIPTSLEHVAELIQKGERAAALSILEDWITQNPDDPEAWLLFFTVLDNPIEKCDCLKQAVRLRPKDQQLKLRLRKYRAGAEYRNARDDIHEIQVFSDLKEKEKRKNKGRLERFFQFLNEVLRKY